MAKSAKPYFPVFMDISEKKIFVIGAGTIAKRRIRSLIEFTNHLTVVAPEVNPELLGLEEKGRITILKKNFEEEDIRDADMVIVATNDHSLNNCIYEYCKKNGIFVNVSSDKHKCDFYFPGLAMKDNVVVGVTANGTNHKKARLAVEKIRELLETCW